MEIAAGQSWGLDQLFVYLYFPLRRMNYAENDPNDFVDDRDDSSLMIVSFYALMFLLLPFTTAGSTMLSMMPRRMMM